MIRLAGQTRDIADNDSEAFASFATVTFFEPKNRLKIAEPPSKAKPDHLKKFFREVVVSSFIRDGDSI